MHITISQYIQVSSRAGINLNLLRFWSWFGVCHKAHAALKCIMPFRDVFIDLSRHLPTWLSVKYSWRCGGGGGVGVGVHWADPGYRLRSAPVNTIAQGT